MDPLEALEDAQMKTPEDRTGGACENPTVLEAFAGRALEGILSNESLMKACEAVSAHDGRPMPEQVAETAYRYADAMLLARKKYL